MKVNKYRSSHWSYEHKSWVGPCKCIARRFQQMSSLLPRTKHGTPSPYGNTSGKACYTEVGWRVEHVCSCQNDWLHDIQNPVSFFSIYFFLCLSLDFPSHPKTQKKTKNPKSKLQNPDQKASKRVCPTSVSAHPLTGRAAALPEFNCLWLEYAGNTKFRTSHMPQGSVGENELETSCAPMRLLSPPKKNAPVFSRASWASSCGTFRVPILFLVAR